MKNMSRSALLMLALAYTGVVPAWAGEVVHVKYRGSVDLAPFMCGWTPRSSVVKRLCYDAKERYVVVNLTGTYYHYCEVPASTVSSWRTAESLGKFFNSRIKGNFGLPRSAGS